MANKKPTVQPKVVAKPVVTPKPEPVVVKPIEVKLVVVPIVPVVIQEEYKKSITISAQEKWAIIKATEIATAGICDNTLKNVLNGIINKL